jgi:hypothetical protein
MRTAESCSSYGPPPGVDFALRPSCGLAADWMRTDRASLLPFGGSGARPVAVVPRNPGQRLAQRKVGVPQRRPLTPTRLFASHGAPMPAASTTHTPRRTRSSTFSSIRLMTG